MTPTTDVLGLGNAIVDLLSFVEEDFLEKENLVKGSMHLIEEARAESLYKMMGPITEVSGGSVANSIAGVASLGGKAEFVGKVRNDRLGNSFAHDIRATGVRFDSKQATDGPATARSFILVTPDGQRTMNTYLGACLNISADDVSEEQAARAKIVFLEGFLWGPPGAKDAFRKAASIAHAHGRAVALTLSDSLWVESQRAEFLQFIHSKMIDIVLANVAEVKALYETSDFDSALEQLRRDVKLAAVTRSEHGCVVVRGDETHVVPAFSIDRLVDTTGAGDLFAAGFLFGLARGDDLRRCGELGCLVASEILDHLGARPQVSLRQLAVDHALL